MNEIQYTVTGHPVRMRGAAYIPRSIQALQALSQWKIEGRSQGAPLQWLREDICKAFMHFIGLRLGDPPAAELMPITAELWVEIIGEGMTEDQDRERIRQGFNILRRGLKWWPKPEALFKVIPRRVTTPAGHPVQAGQSEEDHAAASARLQDIMDSLK